MMSRDAQGLFELMEKRLSAAALSEVRNILYAVFMSGRSTELDHEREARALYVVLQRDIVCQRRFMDYIESTSPALFARLSTPEDATSHPWHTDVSRSLLEDELAPVVEACFPLEGTTLLNSTLESSLTDPLPL